MPYIKRNEAGFSLLELSLAIAIGLTILASSFWMLKQHNADARVQQSKLMLATIRTNLAAYRYRFGSYPSLSEFRRNWATPSTNQFQIVPGASRDFDPVRNGTFNEPVSGVMQVLTATTALNAYTGGWTYDPVAGTVSVNLDPAHYPGDNPVLW